MSNGKASAKSDSDRLVPVQVVIIVDTRNSILESLAVETEAAKQWRR